MTNGILSHPDVTRKGEQYALAAINAAARVIESLELKLEAAELAASLNQETILGLQTAHRAELEILHKRIASLECKLEGEGDFCPRCKETECTEWCKRIEARDDIADRKYNESRDGDL